MKRSRESGSIFKNSKRAVGLCRATAVRVFVQVSPSLQSTRHAWYISQWRARGSFLLPRGSPVQQGWGYRVAVPMSGLPAYRTQKTPWPKRRPPPPSPRPPPLPPSPGSASTPVPFLEQLCDNVDRCCSSNNVVPRLRQCRFLLTLQF